MSVTHITAQSSLYSEGTSFSSFRCNSKGQKRKNETRVKDVHNTKMVKERHVLHSWNILFIFLRCNSEGRKKNNTTRVKDVHNTRKQKERTNFTQREHPFHSSGAIPRAKREKHNKSEGCT
jgi:hypothetical protein